MKNVEKVNKRRKCVEGKISKAPLSRGTDLKELLN
jgi:hypothetical protein